MESISFSEVCVLYKCAISEAWNENKLELETIGETSQLKIKEFR